MTGTPCTPSIGIAEWLRPGEHPRTEALLADLHALGVTGLRILVSWTDWNTPEGRTWYDWLLPRLAGEVRVMPCFMYTPPLDPTAYVDFLDGIITRLGEHFEWIELCSEPGSPNSRDRRLDPQGYAALLDRAARQARGRGKKTVLGGIAPGGGQWLEALGQRGVMQPIDAVGLHGLPGPWALDRNGWPESIEAVRRVLERHGLAPELWITQAGYSTWRYDEFKQLCAFARLCEAPVQRIYWYCGHDLPACPADGFPEDERYRHQRHYGLKKADGSPKLLFRIWQEAGLEGVEGLAALGEAAGVPGRQDTPSAPARPRPQRPILITGGAGFIGTNLAHRLLSEGRRVLIFDSLARPGVEHNLRWLWETHGDRLQAELADIRDAQAVGAAVRQAGQVFHFAAQVAVTTSVTDPRHDFAVNALGTLNVLEALRTLSRPPGLVFTSTNKVYGNLEHLHLDPLGLRYEPADPGLRARGVGEDCALDFHSPYGCSKGAADQYVLDYARTYGLPAVVLRMSCIYGPHQWGTEDQGWVAHFLLRTLQGQPLTLYGDGKQVRDILFVDDLLEALLLAQSSSERLRGQAFNIGGGPGNSVSLLELIELIGELHGARPALGFAPWRPGDQKYYVSATGKFTAATGWQPRVDRRAGVAVLYRWLRENLGSRRSSFSPSVAHLSTLSIPQAGVS